VCGRKIRLSAPQPPPSLAGLGRSFLARWRRHEAAADARATAWYISTAVRRGCTASGRRSVVDAPPGRSWPNSPRSGVGPRLRAGRSRLRQGPATDDVHPERDNLHYIILIQYFLGTDLVASIGTGVNHSVIRHTPERAGRRVRRRSVLSVTDVMIRDCLRPRWSSRASRSPWTADHDFLPKFLTFHQLYTLPQPVIIPFVLVDRPGV
jgi:hypothetical protein